MGDPLHDQELVGAISTSRHASVRYRAGQGFGEFFYHAEYDGFTLTIEVSGIEDARAMLEAIGQG